MGGMSISLPLSSLGGVMSKHANIDATIIMRA
jgi:hypothetical protein